MSFHKLALASDRLLFDRALFLLFSLLPSLFRGDREKAHEVRWGSRKIENLLLHLCLLYEFGKVKNVSDPDQYHGVLANLA